MMPIQSMIVNGALTTLDELSDCGACLELARFFLMTRTVRRNHFGESRPLLQKSTDITRNRRWLSAVTPD
ncbi:hypothetical protein C6P88_17410 [Burkholderia contaminans]|nr:hypothetical protein C6P88_17410 [Burkholderia contaminans]